MKKYSLIARDFNSPFIRNYIFTGAFACYPKVFGVPRLDLIMVGIGNDVYYFSDLKNWQECHDAFKNKTLVDYRFLSKIINNFLDLGEKHGQWMKKNIFLSDLKPKTGSDLMKLYEEFIKRQSELYSWGVSVVVLDFQGFSFVENNLKKILEEKLPARERPKCYALFTQPAKFSFSQEQDLALLKLMARYYSPRWKRAVLAGNLEALRLSYPKFIKDLENHAKRYAWVYYVYAGPAYTAQNYYEFIKNYLSKNIRLAARLQEILTAKLQVAAAKSKYLNRLKLTPFERHILLLAGQMIWAKPRRKDYQSRIYYYAEKLQREIGRRLDLSLAQVRSLPPEMLKQALLTGVSCAHYANAVFKAHLCIPKDDGVVTVKIGQSALKFKAKNLPTETNLPARAEFKGQTAYGGKARGVVKILNKAEEIGKMNDGDILVSVATTPAIVPAMKKAAAILTDEGGLTCHASIVSRELKIPCVVGLKNITLYLKDGDRVSVDAAKGVVKKII